jgi:hypothetical protein
MADDVRTTSEPHDRGTRMCAAMTAAFDAHPEHRPGDRCIVFFDDGKMGGISVHDYEDMTEAMVDLFLHLRAMFRSQGKELQFIGIPDSPPEKWTMDNA